MADWSELKAIMLPFPCLWDPRDPYFLDKTVKAVCREQVLVIFNQRSGMPIDMESLKQWIADNLKHSTQTHEIATEKLPITTSPQSSQSVPSKVAECTAQEITSTEKLPIATSSQDGQSVPAECTAHEIIATEKLPISTLSQGDQSVPAEYTAQEIIATEKLPISTLPQGDQSVPTECTAQEIIATEKLPITTSPQGGQSAPSKVAESIAQEITTTEKPPVTTQPQKRPSVKRKVRVYKARRVPTLDDLIKEYPCLWNREDLNYQDNTMKSRCRKLLLQKFNRLSSTEITMADLRRKLSALYTRLWRLGRGKSSSSTSLLDHAERNQETVSTQGKPTLDDLIKEYPCLWNREDLNYQDNTMRSRCRKLLLQKFNRLSSTEITMADLRRKLSALNLRLWRLGRGKSSSSTSLLDHAERNQETVSTQGKPTLDDLIKEYPCLWNREDLNYQDITMKSRCRKLLLQKFNRLSSTEITMADLRRKLSALYTRLWRLGRGKSSSSTSLLDHAERNQETVSAQGKPTLDDLITEYPCLWNREDLNYQDNTMRSRCRELLLQKFNRLSSTEITMADLRRKLKALNIRQWRLALGKSSPSSASSLLAHVARNQKTASPQGTPTLKDMLKPYPCLWDPDDLNFCDKTIRARSERELLDKFNRLSSIQINMSDLKRKLATFKFYRYRNKAKEAKRQTEVHEISDGNSGTDGEEIEVQETTAENFTIPDNSQTAPEATIDSIDANRRPQDAPSQEGGRCLEVLFNYCRFCGELKISSDTNDIKHYVANNKCALIINDLRAELEFTDDILPRHVCKDCDRKFKEMVDFVKCVKDAQVKFNHFNNETLDRRRENEDLLAEHEKADGQRERCKITIDFNSDNLQPLSDNNDENMEIEMNNDYEIGSFLEIDTESEERNESNVPINNNSPSLSLCNENTNSIKSHCHRPESVTNYIRTHADFLKNKTTNDKIYVNTRRKDFEDDVNNIFIKLEDETAAKDVNDKQKRLNAGDTCDDNRKKIYILNQHKQLVMQRARKKAQLNNEM